MAKTINSETFFGARAETINRLSKLYKNDYFSKRKNESGELRKKMYLQEFFRIKKYLNFFEKGNVLDIGCGSGEFLSFFSEEWTKFGIEISENARRSAEKKGIITKFKLKDSFFDLIVFRGTIQHIPDPVKRIGECYYWLKEGGMLVFLATPNTNSISYRLFCDLPMLNKEHNFMLPSDKMLRQILENFGFRILEFKYPYLETPYAHPFKDYLNFLLRLVKIKKKVDFPFYGNIMECYAIKPFS